ncbi:beta strand repeat-containing protein [Psychrobacter sanguinis]|uniref:beta strand repeat-containing protein n=1 Tax=Psychrobacter sanguinis TaxID=861445 RepID=UPI0019186D81|nr:Ig-like domain-containing protein [Psychrobacter sanguinis]MCC3345023.1 Ig-like domain-containing protein [Psychrobacter sanguinis]
MNTIIIKVNNAVKTIAEYEVVTKDGQPTIIKAINKVNYELIDQSSGLAPDHIVTKRVGKDLHISIEEGGRDSDLIIEGFYEEADSALIGQAENGNYYYYTPDTGEVTDFVTELAPGDIEGQVLGGNVQPTPYWVGATSDNGFVWLPWLVGLAGLGAIVALANDDDEKDSTTPATPDGIISIDSYTDNVELNSGDYETGSSTNDTTPLLNGTVAGLESGNGVGIYSNTGMRIGAAAVTDNKFTYQLTDLVDGSHIYVARVEDAAGNVGSASDEFEIKVDTTAPVAPDVTNSISIDSYTDDVDSRTDDFETGVTTNDIAPLLNGTVTGLEKGDVVGIYSADGVRLGTAFETEGKFSYQLADLAEGSSNIYVAKIEDAAGNVGTVSSNFVIKIDTSAPTENNSISIDSYTDDVELNTGEFGSGSTTNDAEPVLNGTVSGLKSGDGVGIYSEGGARLGTAILMTDGKFTYELSGWVYGSSNTYVAKIEDAAGNPGTVSNKFEIKVDIIAPTENNSISIDSYTDNADLNTGDFNSGSITNDATPVLNGTVTGLENGNMVGLYNDAGARLGTAVVANGKFSYQLTGLVNDSTNTYVAKIEDAAGNVGTASSGFVIKVDISGPTENNSISIDSYTDNVDLNTGDFDTGSITNDVTPLLKGTVAGLENGDVVGIYSNTGVRLGTADLTANGFSYQLSGLEDDSTNTYVAKIEDAAGNVGTASSNFVIKVDISAPTENNSISIDTYTDNVELSTGNFNSGSLTNDAAPLLNGTVAGLKSGDEVGVYSAAGVRLGTAAVTDNKFSYQLSGLEDDSSNTYVAKIEDAAGNVGTASSSFVIKVDISAPTENNSINIDSYVDNVELNTGNFNSGSTTNDTMPLLNGTVAGLENGDVVGIYNAAGLRLGTADLTANGFSYQLTGLEDDSSNTYVAKIEDAAGNVGTASSSFVIKVDISAPTENNSISIDSYADNVELNTGNFNSGSTTNDAAPLLNGTVAGLESGDVVGIYNADGVRLGKAAVVGDKFSYQLSGLEDDSSNTYVARIENAVGNAGTASSSFVIKVDTNAPTENNSISIDSYTDDVELNTGDFNSGSSTNDATPLLNGTVAGLESGDVVGIYNAAGERLGTADLTANGFSYQLSGLKDDNSNTYVAKIEDAAGNVGTASSNFVIKVDITSPNSKPTVDADTTTPAFDVLTTADTSPVITGTVSKALVAGEILQVTVGGATYEVSVTGKIWSLDTGTAIPKSGVFTDLPSGNNSVVAKIMDEAGNATTDTTDNEIVVYALAQLTGITVTDNVTDIYQGNELTSDDEFNDPNYSENPTDPEGNASIIDGVASSKYNPLDQPEYNYKYEGIVSNEVYENVPDDQGNMTKDYSVTGPLYGSTNDHTPTITITLDKQLDTNFQTLDVVRYYQRADGEWVLDNNVSNGGVVDGIVASINSTDGADYTFDDELPDSGIDKNYRYEAVITNSIVIANTTLVNSQVTEFELDTEANTPLITYTDGVLSGSSNEDGVIYIDFGDRVINQEDKYIEVIVKEGEDWRLELTGPQKTWFERINDPDNYDTNGNNEPSAIVAEIDTNGNIVEDGFLPIGFVDKAGNILTIPVEFYYFNNEDGPRGKLNPEDNPVTAINTFTDANGVTSIAGVTQVNGVNTYTTTFTDDSQIIYVDGNMDAYNDIKFVVNMAGGNDVLNLKGNITPGVVINMGEGDDTVIAETLQGFESNPVVIDLGNGNNTVTKSWQGKFNYLNIIAGDGDDVFNMKFDVSDFEHGNLSLGGGNNSIYSYDDILDATVATDDGDDYIFVDAPATAPTTTGCDISGSFGLGDGNDKIELVVGSINIYGTGNTGNAINSGTNVDMGAGDDVIDLGLDISNNYRGASYNTVDTGTGNDIVNVGRHIEGTHGSGIVTVKLGEGDDILNVGENINDAIVNMGDGADTVTVTGQLTGNSVINLGAGNDTINLGYFNDDSGSLINGGDGIDTLNLTGNNTGGNNDIAINNVEIVQLAGNDAKYDLDWDDIMLSDGTNDSISEIYINQSGSNNEIELTGWTQDTGVTPPAIDPLGEVHIYDTYVQSQGGITETLYIEQGITVI